MFINYESGETTIRTYRTSGALVCELSDILHAIENNTDESLVCDLDGAENTLRNGEYLAAVNVSQDTVEKLHDAILEASE